MATCPSFETEIAVLGGILVTSQINTHSTCHSLWSYSLICRLLLRDTGNCSDSSSSSFPSSILHFRSAPLKPHIVKKIKLFHKYNYSLENQAPSFFSYICVSNTFFFNSYSVCSCSCSIYYTYICNRKTLAEKPVNYFSMFNIDMEED